MTRVGAFDCGTNSLRLLIADVDHERGALVDVDRRMEVVRLGEGVDATGRIADDALDRTLKVTRFYAALCAEAGVSRVRFVATSASRDAQNRDVFVDGVRALLGVEPEVVTGRTEAELSFVGATTRLFGSYEAPFLVVDIGGGSTELVLGADTVEAGCSIDIGCVRLTESQLTADPPTRAQLAAATTVVDEALASAEAVVPFRNARTFVGLAGTVTTVTAHALGLPGYDEALIDLATLPVEDVVAACADLTAMTRDERAALPYMHPGRADVIGAGALIWGRVVERVAQASGITHVLTSEHDILDGIAYSLAEPSQ